MLGLGLVEMVFIAVVAIAIVAVVMRAYKRTLKKGVAARTRGSGDA